MPQIIHCNEYEQWQIAIQSYTVELIMTSIQTLNAAVSKIQMINPRPLPGIRIGAMWMTVHMCCQSNVMMPCYGWQDIQYQYSLLTSHSWHTVAIIRYNVMLMGICRQFGTFQMLNIKSNLCKIRFFCICILLISVACCTWWYTFIHNDFSIHS